MNNSLFPTVIFKEWTCIVRPVLYPDGSPGLVLEDANDGSPVATATVNLPSQLREIIEMTEDDGYDLSGAMLVFIKDYSENEGMFRALCEGNECIIDDPIYGRYGVPRCIYASSGYIEQIPLQYICHDGLLQGFDQLYADLASEQPAYNTSDTAGVPFPKPRVYKKGKGLVFDKYRLR